MSAGGSLRDSLRLLATRRFGTFWFASLLSNIGTWAQQVAEPWLLLGIGASPFILGLDSFAMNAPVLVLTLGGGLLADRADRRRVITLFQSIQMLCPTLIVVLLLRGSIHPLVVVALSLVVGVTDALSMPSFQSIVPSIVERERIGRALALNSTQFSLSRILGPALAGVLLASVGAVACFAVSAASYVPFIAVALWVLPRHASSLQRADLEHPFRGFRQIARTPDLRRALGTVLTTGVFCSPLVTFAPVLVKEALHGDAARFSASVGAFGIGGLAGGVTLLVLSTERDRRRLTTRFAMAHGVVVVGAALLPGYWGFPLLMVLAGCATTLSNTSANSLLQSSADPALLGQTVSLYMLALRGGLSFGSLLTGLTVNRFGVRAALAGNGFAAIAILFAIDHAWQRSGSSR